MQQKSKSEAKIVDDYEDFISHKKDFFTFSSEFKPPDQIIWELPCSKSHFIRWLFIAAQSENDTVIKTPCRIGDDITSCANVLEVLGVNIQKNNDTWVVNGCKPGSYNLNPGILDCGNSATTLRFISFLVARNGINATIKGDESLSSRNFSELIYILEKGGISIKKEPSKFLPFTLSGIFNLSEIDVFTNKTSQLLSAILITMPSSIEKNKLIFSEKIVSKPYFNLTLKLCKKTGAEVNYLGKILEIKTWIPQIINPVVIPGEASLIVFALLFCKLHGCSVLVKNCPSDEESLGFYKLKEYVSNLGLVWIQGHGSIKLNIAEGESDNFTIDISENIDLITPLSLLLAISKGGTIKGITHAENKESNRIKSTIDLCEKFGFKSSYNSELIIYQSNISPPKNLIFANRDHRLQMSAMILLTYSGGMADSFEWYANSDPDFMKRLYCQGVSIN